MSYAVEILKAQLQRVDLQYIVTKRDHFQAVGSARKMELSIQLQDVLTKVEALKRAIQILSINERGLV